MILPDLQRRLASTDPGTRRDAVWEAAFTSDLPPEIIGKLSSISKYDSKPSTRRAAAMAVLLHVPKDPFATAVFVQLLFHRRDKVRATTAREINSHVDILGNVEMFMALALLDSCSRVRVQALGYFRNLGRDTSDCSIETIARLLRDPNAGVIQEAGFALASIGPQAVSALPELIEASLNNSSKARWAVIEALGTVAPDHPAALATVVRLFIDPDPEIREAAAGQLEYFGESILQFLDPMLDLLNDENLYVPICVTNALVRLGAQATVALSRLQQMALSDNETLRVRAEEAIGKIQKPLEK